jgi:hypothetical protein
MRKRYDTQGESVEEMLERRERIRRQPRNHPRDILSHMHCGTSASSSLWMCYDLGVHTVKRTCFMITHPPPSPLTLKRSFWGGRYHRYGPKDRDKQRMERGEGFSISCDVSDVAPSKDWCRPYPICQGGSQSCCSQPIFQVGSFMSLLAKKKKNLEAPTSP